MKMIARAPVLSQGSWNLDPGGSRQLRGLSGLSTQPHFTQICTRLHTFWGVCGLSTHFHIFCTLVSFFLFTPHMRTFISVYICTHLQKFAQFYILFWGMWPKHKNTLSHFVHTFSFFCPHLTCTLSYLYIFAHIYINLHTLARFFWLSGQNWKRNG